MPGEMGKQIRHPAAALAVLLEFPERLHDPACGPDPCLRDRALIEKLEHLPVISVEPRLVIVAVQMAHAAAHEEENHALGARREMRGANGERVGGAAGRDLRCEAGQCEITETAGELL